MQLDLWLHGELVATTEITARGRMVLAYTAGIADRYPAETPVLSCALPTPGPAGPGVSRAFLEGLLPEGVALRSIASQVGASLENGAPRTPDDLVRLLAGYGWECAGAVVVVEHGQPLPRPGRYRSLPHDQVAALLADLHRRPFGADPALGVRMSLGGAQPKLLLAYRRDHWALPVGTSPSTHILKPTLTWSYSAQNEALVMHLAQAVGLTPQAPRVANFGGLDCLVSARYDRRAVGGQIVRVHQEDMGQALGIRPVDKYSTGQLTDRMVRLLRIVAANPSRDIRSLFRHLAFRSIVGDEDSHAKNTSVLLEHGRVALAPLYDSLCTLAYPELTGTMATPIGPQRSLAKVDRPALVQHAAGMGIGEPEASSIVRDLLDGMRAALASLPAPLLDGWPSHDLVDILDRRLERLSRGLPMGRDRLPSVWHGLGDAAT